MSNYPKLWARSLLECDTDELIRILTGKFILVFDNKEELLTNYKETIYSSFVWDFHRLHPELPLVKEHHVRSLFKCDQDGNYISGNNTNTHIKLFNRVYWDLHAIRNKNNPAKFDDYLNKKTFDGINKLHNFLSQLDEFTESFDILDYLEITEIPEIKEYYDKIEPTQDGIENGYKLLKEVLAKDERLKNNPLVKANRSGSIKEMQLLQVVGSRGKVTDIDSYQFDKPITRGYINGFKTIYETLIESRPAAQSLFFNKDTLRSSEYFSRRLQIQTEPVERVHPGDCGSQNYLSFKLSGENYDSHGRLTKKKDTHYFKGKYYLDETTNQLKELKEEDEHYIGKVLKFRSPIAGCFHPDPKGICSVCYSVLASSVPTNANLGHLASTTLMEKISQAILSLKHYQGSALIEKIVLTALQERFFITNEKANAYLFKKDWINKDLKVVIPKDEIIGITDLNIVDDLSTVNGITHFSEISNVSFIIQEDHTSEIIPVDIGIGRRKGSLTYYALNYIRENKYEHDAKGNYIIDLSNWDYDRIFIKLPDIHVNASDLAKEIESLIESKKSQLHNRNTVNAASELLYELHNTVNNVLDINIALLEVLVFGSMVIDSSNNDYRLPKGNDRKGLGVSEITIINRSLGGAMGYEEHTAIIQNPETYLNKNRVSHPLDVFIKPNETVKDMEQLPWIIKD